MSSGWLGKFKSRYQLVSRRTTTCQRLPEDYKSIAVDFLAKTQDLIAAKSISPARIINSFWRNHRAITKDSHLHQPFVALHVLFSKLKKSPLVNPKCFVDVSNTGMWNQKILQNFIKNIILLKIQSHNEPTLIILDSYAAHLSFIQTTTKRTTRREMFISP